MGRLLLSTCDLPGAHGARLSQWVLVTICVVGAAILDEDGRLLAARRSEPPALAGGWELPGGKVEPGEQEEAALVRECAEELGVVIRLLRRVGDEWPMSGDAVLRVWTAQITSGEPRPLEDHSELRWLDPGRWYDVAWLAADLPVVHYLQQHPDLLAAAAVAADRHPPTAGESTT
jgi:8-oxo-dGTP diphosphatase